ncbi:MAG TPA: mitochondrial fission ELM1 family protein [Rhizomicrobium sp.]|nr:mitochondrial fission ELM1 family protein [Rhizomicrobium sp.]
MTNGTVGMENQAMGLAERLDLPVVAKRVRLAWPWNMLAPLSLGSPFSRLAAGSDAIAPPWPRLAIGVGRESIPLMTAIKAASGGRTLLVQCQDPRVRLSLFDLVIPPEHDAVNGPNVFSILGSPNRITPAKLADARRRFADRFQPLRAPRLAVLVGGNSKAYRLDSNAVENLTSALVELSKTMGLMVTVSRRTGTQNVARIASALKGSDAYFWDGEGENPYLGVLAWADAFLVTADSVNMACDAAATGKPVHIFPLPGGSAKFDRFHQALMARGISRTFKGRIEQWDYAPLDETGRAAKRIGELLDVSANAPDMG